MKSSAENPESPASTQTSIAQAILDASRQLREAGVPDSRREAGSLLSYVIGRDRTFLISHSEDFLSEAVLDHFAAVVQRRAMGEPHQYITGVQEFYGLAFKVTPDVLIPRPETELLVESAIGILQQKKDPSLICDIGTGSGCIAITLLHELPAVRAVAIDISEAAIRITQANAVHHAVSDRLSLLVADCFASLNNSSPGFDLIVSNPPYVSAAAMPGLQREVRDHEPQVALTPGADGLSVIRRLLEDGPYYLKRDGYLLIEIGFDQEGAIRQMISPRSWRLLDIKPDLQGIPRMVVLQKQ